MRRGRREGPRVAEWHGIARDAAAGLRSRCPLPEDHETQQRGSFATTSDDLWARYILIWPLRRIYELSRPGLQLSERLVLPLVSARGFGPAASS